MNKPASSHEQDDGEEPHEERNTGALPQAGEWHYCKVLELPSPPIEETEEQWEEARWHSRQKIEWNYTTRGWQWANGWGGLRQAWNQRSCPSSSWHFETGSSTRSMGRKYRRHREMATNQRIREQQYGKSDPGNAKPVTISRKPETSGRMHTRTRPMAINTD